jgi:hypothetical protein
MCDSVRLLFFFFFFFLRLDGGPRVTRNGRVLLFLAKVVFLLTCGVLPIHGCGRLLYNSRGWGGSSTAASKAETRCVVV